MKDEYLRYSCQMNLPLFGKEKQELLTKARVLVVGAGGLGCPALQYLASAGVGHIGIVDHDHVQQSNLHRQILYTPSDYGKAKALIAAERLLAQNPHISVTAHQVKLDAGNAMRLFADYQIILDCTDNFDARYLINDAAVLSGKPVVYGAIYQFEGQVSLWNAPNSDGSRSVNFRDLFPKVDPTQIPNCSTGGVIPTIAGIIGCMQANETIKYITSQHGLLAGKMLILDTQTMQSKLIKLGSSTQAIIKSLMKTFEIPTIDPTSLREELSTGNTKLIDVRTDRERDEFDIGGIHIELDEIIDYLDIFKEEYNYVFYCSSGKRSAEAVRLLKSEIPGIRAFSLKGGVGAWLKEESQV